MLVGGFSPPPALKNLSRLSRACGRCLGDARWHRLGAPQHPGDQRNALLVLVAMEIFCPKSGENAGEIKGHWWFEVIFW